jgi:glycine reductase
MRLELRILRIRDVQFAEKTTISDGILYINSLELCGLLQQDKRLSKVDVELAHPGEKCRILQVSDIIEPRAKISENAIDFPGALGKQEPVGVGSSCVLRNVAVVINDQSDVSGPSLTPLGNVIDMSGPGAELSLYGKTHNVVVLPHPADEINPSDYKIALKLAGLKTAVYLAQAGKDLRPDRAEVYDLPPLTEVIKKGMEDLPKVAYIFQVYSTNFPPIAGEPILYGDNIVRLLPTIVHPNEILDGALVNPYFGMGMETYAFQNHPLIKELYRRHGKDLCFVGVILTTSHSTEPERERSAAMAAKLAKFLLGADGAILTKAGGGAPELDVAQTAAKCEELGVRTVFVMWQLSSPADGGIMFNMPNVDALVSMASPSEIVTLPPVERIIGKSITLRDGSSPSSELKRIKMWIPGSVDQLGHSKLISVLY